MSRLRVSGGLWRGIPLKAPASARPTAERVRQAVFSSLAGGIEGADVADLFCGSGSWGLDAMSRGAQSGVFVDNNAGAVAAVKANIAACGARATVIRSDARRWIKATEQRFGLIFADPPYGSELLDPSFMSAVSDALNPDGTAVVEVRQSDPAPVTPSDLGVADERVYGDTRILVYRRTRT